MADGRLLILQARPITALPCAPEVDLPPGTWVKDTGRYAEPMTAFGASLAAPIVAEGLSSMWAAYGGLLERIETRGIGGEPYARVVPFGGRDGPPPPWWALGLLARVAPRLRRRMRAARRMVRPEVLAGLVDRWHVDWRPDLEPATDRLRAVDLDRLDDAQLEAHLGDVIELAKRGAPGRYSIPGRRSTARRRAPHPTYAAYPAPGAGSTRRCCAGWSSSPSLRPHRARAGDTRRPPGLARSLPRPGAHRAQRGRLSQAAPRRRTRRAHHRSRVVGPVRHRGCACHRRRGPLSHGDRRARARGSRRRRQGRSHSPVA